MRDNYLNKVVGGRHIGDHIYFQGVTARNKALVAAFEVELQKPIAVSPYCHLTGSLGLSLLVRERETGATVVCLFYDGSGDPNQALVPVLHYLREPAPV